MKTKVAKKEETKTEKAEKLKKQIIDETLQPKLATYDRIVDHLAETVYALKLESTKAKLADGEKYVKSNDARITEMKQEIE